MAIDLVEGETITIPYTLQADGQAQDLTGMTVGLIAYDHKGRLLTLSGDVTVVDQTAGKVAFNPDSADLVAANSPMYVRWKVTDGSGKVGFYPNGAAEQWIVLKP